jgi:hypothetical protein
MMNDLGQLTVPECVYPLLRILLGWLSSCDKDVSAITSIMSETKLAWFQRVSDLWRKYEEDRSRLVYCLSSEKDKIIIEKRTSQERTLKYAAITNTLLRRTGGIQYKFHWDTNNNAFNHSFQTMIPFKWHSMWKSY